MSFLSKMGLVTEVVEETTTETPSESKQEVKQTATAPKTSSLSFAPIVAPVVSGDVIGKVDNDIFNKLSVAIEENNLAGNDFLEFMQSLNKMGSLAVDEKTKFNMVFATLGTADGGMSKEKLVESIAHYLNVINNEKTTFEGEMASASAEMVGEKEKQIEGLSLQAQQKTEQIQKLSAEIQEISEGVATLKSESAQAKIQIAQKQADFKVTVQQLEGQILDYKTKINQHIQ